jgi:hypothetical protein
MPASSRRSAVHGGAVTPEPFSLSVFDELLKATKPRFY